MRAYADDYTWKLCSSYAWRCLDFVFQFPSDRHSFSCIFFILTFVNYRRLPSPFCGDPSSSLYGTAPCQSRRRGFIVSKESVDHGDILWCRELCCQYSPVCLFVVAKLLLLCCRSRRGIWSILVWFTHWCFRRMHICWHSISLSRTAPDLSDQGSITLKARSRQSWDPFITRLKANLWNSCNLLTARYVCFLVLLASR